MKINIVNENSNKYRRVNKALFGDPTGKIKTFAIISAYNPLGWKDSTEEEFIIKFKKWLNNPAEYNRLMNKKLKAEVLADRIIKTGNDTLKYGHFDYVEIKGFYVEHERTLMIFNIPLKDALITAKNYGQESFFYGKTNADKNSIIGYYKTTNCCHSYKLIENSNTITFEDDALEFFSKFGIKFRINMQEFGDNVTPVMNNDEFEKSLDETYTFMSRAEHRYNSFT